MAAIFDIKLIALLRHCTSARNSIDDRSEWLNQIINQIEWVGSGSVMDAEGREQTRGGASSRKGGADDGVAVVEQTIAPIFVMAPEALEQPLPIGTRSLGFQIVWIAGT